MPGSVLVPMDNSPPSKAALEYALTSYDDVDITVLYVINSASVVGYGDLSPITVQNDYGKERAERVFETAKRIAEEYETGLETVTERGTPTHTIIRFIDENELDRIIIGSHCRTGFDRLLLGSVAERVARRASVPVTIVPPHRSD